jgi:hypothetical protein
MNATAVTRRSESQDWEPVFAANQARFQLAAGSLLSCAGCIAHVLSEARIQVEAAQIPARFQYGFALRALVQIVLRHLRHCSECIRGGVMTAVESDAPFPFKALPAQERLVYFLRDILGFSRRDVSLLIAITDSQADQLLALARRRIQLSEATWLSSQFC